MKHTRPIISFCIPTYNRLDILYNTIASFYSDMVDVDLADFEIIVSDNEPNQSAKTIVDKFEYDNIHYFHTDCEGFLNSVNALKCGNGLFLKLHNNYTKLRSGSLRKIIFEIKNNHRERSVIFYTDGLLQTGKVQSFSSFDTFMFDLSYFSSWSTGFGIWKDDFDSLYRFVSIDEFFPHTSFLLCLTDNNEFIINDTAIFDNQNIPKKGGYNIFKVFSVDYLSLIEYSLNKKDISLRTFNKIKSDLLLNYLAVRYFKTVILKLDNFEKTDIKKNLKVYYSELSYYLMILTAFISPIKFFIRKIKIKI